MPFEVQKVSCTTEKNRFILQPWEIYKDHPHWVPPLIAERKKFLDPKKNPFFEHADVEYFLALDSNKKPVGRIAAIIDRTHNEFHSERTGFFGMFESIDNQDVANLLFDAARKHLKDRKMEKLLGPMNLSTNHECGLLVEGFDTPPMMGTPYNPPYYHQLFSEYGFVKSKDLISFKLHPKTVPEHLTQAMGRIGKRNRFTIRTFRMDSFTKELDILWDIYNSAWDRNWGFVPMTQKEFLFAAEDLKQVVEPDFCLIAEVAGEPIGFSLTLPDINVIFKKLNGKLFPLGWVHFLLNKNRINTYRTITLGVKKRYRRLGVDVAFYYETFKELVRRKSPVLEMSWVLEDNKSIMEPIQRIGGTIYKRHRIYERKCNG